MKDDPEAIGTGTLTTDGALRIGAPGLAGRTVVWIGIGDGCVSECFLDGKRICGSLSCEGEIRGIVLPDGRR